MSKVSVQERVNRLQGKVRAKTTLHTAIRSSPIYKDYIDTLNEALAEERDRYESTPADEYTRGRISMLKDLLEEIK